MTDRKRPRITLIYCAARATINMPPWGFRVTVGDTVTFTRRGFALRQSAERAARGAMVAPSLEELSYEL